MASSPYRWMPLHTQQAGAVFSGVHPAAWSTIEG